MAYDSRVLKLFKAHIQDNPDSGLVWHKENLIAVICDSGIHTIDTDARNGETIWAYEQQCRLIFDRTDMDDPMNGIRLSDYRYLDLVIPKEWQEVLTEYSDIEFELWLRFGGYNNILGGNTNETK